MPRIKDYMKKAVALLFCAVICITCFAQRNMKDGYVVLNNGDTLKGFIDYREWYKNPVSVLYSAGKEKGRQAYKIKDISSFAVIGREEYRRYTVNISMDRQMVGNIGERDTSSSEGTVFLKIITEGKYVTLFSYTDDVKKRLYVLPADAATPVELQHSEYISDGQVANALEYRNVLSRIARTYTPDAKDIKALIYDQPYSPNTMAEICNRINGVTATTTAKQQDAATPSRFRFFAGAGINRGLISFGGANHYAGKTKGATYGPVVMAGADIFINPAIGRMFLRSQLSASAYKTEAYTFVKYFEAKENYYLQFKQQNIALHEQLNYNVYNGQHLKWFIGAGAGFNFSSYRKNEETFIRQGLSDTTTRVNSNYVPTLKKFWLNAVFRSGFTISKLDVAVAYYPKSALSQNTTTNVDNTSLQLQVVYLFGK